MAEDSLRNTRLLTAQLRDAARVTAQQVAGEVMAKAPETATTALGAEIFNLRSEPPSYDTNLQAKVVELDGSCKTSLAALQLLHQEASLEMNNPQAAFNESNSKVATRSQKLATAITGLEAKTQQAEAPHQPPRKPLQ